MVPENHIPSFICMWHLESAKKAAYFWDIHGQNNHMHIMVVVREFLYPLQNYNVVALTCIAAKTNIVRPISVTREASGKR